MADTRTETTTPKADSPARTETAAPKAAETAARAVEAPARAAAATVKTAAKAARKPARARKVATDRKPAKRAVAAAARAVRAARATITTTTTSINEGTRTMKNEAKQAADRFQAVFGDVNERARTAIERNTRIAEELSELGKGNVEAFVASTKVAAKGVEKIGQEVAELSRKSFEDASSAMKRFADVKSPTDFFRLQAEFARSQFDMAIAESSRLSETMIKFAGQAAEPITSRYSVAAERVRSAVAF